MAEENDKWTNDNSHKGPTLSTRTSSFEALDPHDPNLSRLATSMFQKTADYLSGELTSTQDYYNLLEQMNRLTASKYSELNRTAAALGKTITDHNDMYSTTIQPLLMQIDTLEENVTKFESAAYRLDHYTKSLKKIFKEIENKS